VRRAAGPFTAAASLFGLSLILLWRGRGDGDIAEFQRYGDAITGGQLPYRDFHLEYPPGAVPFFTIPSFGPAHDYLTIFHVLAVAGVLVGLLLLALLLERLGAPRLTCYAALGFAAASPALLGSFTLNRFDMWSAALCLGVLLLLVTDRPIWAFALLAVATLVKTYPVALLPIALLFVDRRARLRGLAVFCAVGLLVLAPIAAIAHAGLYNAYAVQWNRHLQIETIGGSILLVLHRSVRIAFDSGAWSLFGGGADAVANLQTAAQAVGVIAAAVFFARSRRTPWDLVAAAAGTIAVAACAGKVLSPQFLLWLAPLVVLGRSRLAAGLLGAAMLLTNLLFPDRYAGLLARHDGEIWLLVVRNALLVGMLVTLFITQARRVANVASADG
jgi:hypothetical protein